MEQKWGGRWININDQRSDLPDSDLTINGKGSLTVTGAASNAIKSKDGIRIVDATITITAKKHGIAANDFINVSGATLNLTADQDAAFTR